MHQQGESGAERRRGGRQQLDEKQDGERESARELEPDDDQKRPDGGGTCGVC